MKTTRHQKGYVYKKGRWWYVRFYDDVMQENGSIERIQVARKVAPVCDDYRTKRSVLPVVEEMLRPLNNGHYAPESTMTVERFVDTIYLPYVTKQKRPSTFRGYRDIWEYHLKTRCGSVRLRDFHTSTGEQLLADIAHSNDLSRTMLKHIKSVLSGVFKHARRLGVLHTANPMQDVSIPKAREGAETRFYTPKEITRMFFVLPEPASTIAALAAFTGMRRGELAALVWENYEGVSVRVTQSVWGSHISKPKTRQSEAPVPVIAPLATKLESYRQTQGNPTSGLMFPSRKGTPLNLNNLLNRVIRPAFDRAGLEWKGWHAFRRGLATNLYQLGVPDKTIQTILRHSDVSTTLRHYVKTSSADAVQAMRSLEAICTSMHHSTEVELERVV